jgi:hypothetical protein
VLEGGGILDCLVFAAQMAVDWIRTYGLLLTESKADDSMSLLGLGERGLAYGCIDRPTVDVSLVFAVAGLALACAGWYTYLVVLPSWFF